jgi:poly(3-hydroxybutyrate) depolymerase
MRKRPLAVLTLTAALAFSPSPAYAAPSLSEYMDTVEGKMWDKLQAWLELWHDEQHASVPAAPPSTAPAPSATPTPAPTASPSATPTPVPAVPVGNTTGGTGGAYTDRQTVSFTGAGRTSQYHVYAGHIDRAKPVKIHVHLHGDGAYEFKSPTSTVPRAYLAEAKEDNAILVIPKTPNADNTWWTDRTASDWLAALVQDFYAKYPIDRSDVWFSGFSGGSQALSQHFIPKHYGLISGGGIVLTGGGTVSASLTPAGAAIGKSLEVHYVAGTADTGGAGSDNNGFNAHRAATTGAPKWRTAGFTDVTLDEISGATHNGVAAYGPRAIDQYR